MNNLMALLPVQTLYAAIKQTDIKKAYDTIARAPTKLAPGFRSAKNASEQMNISCIDKHTLENILGLIQENRFFGMAVNDQISRLEARIRSLGVWQLRFFYSILERSENLHITRLNKNTISRRKSVAGLTASSLRPMVFELVKRKKCSVNKLLFFMDCLPDSKRIKTWVDIEFIWACVAHMPTHETGQTEIIGDFGTQFLLSSLAIDKALQDYETNNYSSHFLMELEGFQKDLHTSRRLLNRVAKYDLSLSKEIGSFARTLLKDMLPKGATDEQAVGYAIMKGTGQFSEQYLKDEARKARQKNRQNIRAGAVSSVSISIPSKILKTLAKANANSMAQHLRLLLSDFIKSKLSEQRTVINDTENATVSALARNSAIAASYGQPQVKNEFSNFKFELAQGFTVKNLEQLERTAQKFGLSRQELVRKIITHSYLQDFKLQQASVATEGPSALLPPGLLGNTYSSSEPNTEQCPARANRFGRSTTTSNSIEPYAEESNSIENTKKNNKLAADTTTSSKNSRSKSYKKNLLVETGNLPITVEVRRKNTYIKNTKNSSQPKTKAP